MSKIIQMNSCPCDVHTWKRTGMFSCIVRLDVLPERMLRYLLLPLQVLVVANPAHMIALILKEFAPFILEKNITFLTRLYHNRTLGQISERLNVPVSDIKNAVIWGNHLTQYPDVNYATVKTPSGEKPVYEIFADGAWYEDGLLLISIILFGLSTLKDSHKFLYLKVAWRIHNLCPTTYSCNHQS